MVRMRLDLDLFERPGARLKEAIEDRFEAAARKPACLRWAILSPPC